MTKILIIVAAVIVVLLAVVGIAVASSYNSLYAQRENVDAKWANVETEMQRRADLVPNLVATVQGVFTQEQKVFGDIARAREGLVGALQRSKTGQASKEEVIDADTALTTALSRINFLSLTEAYPQLKSNENALALQSQIEGTENRLRVARQDYNGAVQAYNTARGSFPAVIVAAIFGFDREDDYFKAAPGAQEAPKVELNKDAAPAGR